MAQSNGLVKDVNKYKPPIKEGNFRLKQNNVYFNEYALKGIVEDTPLSQIFFSKSNMDTIQKSIRYIVFQRIQVVIDYQSYNALFIIMRSIYLQNGDSGVNSTQLVEQIKNLNNLVISYCIESQIIPNLQQYNGYLDKIKELPIPLERSKNDSLKGTKTYDISNLM
jgi:hypothetical protein